MRVLIHLLPHLSVFRNPIPRIDCEDRSQTPCGLSNWKCTSGMCMYTYILLAHRMHTSSIHCTRFW